MGFECKRVDVAPKRLFIFLYFFKSFHIFFLSKTHKFMAENAPKKGEKLVNIFSNNIFCYILSKLIKLHKHSLCSWYPAVHVLYIVNEKQKVQACVSAMRAVCPKIVADGLVLPLPLQRNAAATSITSIKLCNKLNSWAATPLTVTGLRMVGGRTDGGTFTKSFGSFFLRFKQPNSPHLCILLHAKMQIQPLQ